MFKNLLASRPNKEVKKINVGTKAGFINVPIQLLAGFLEDTRSSMRNIYHYALYAHFIQLRKGSEKEKYKETCEWYNFQEVDREENLYRGKLLFDRYVNAPMTGIDRNLFTEYNKQDKSDFEKACFLAYHALKSIVADKTFQKCDNRFLWARMDGHPKSIKEISELSENMQFYCQEYQTLKIKRELQQNWGLVYYAQHTRGFYFSFKINLKALILQAMKRKKTLVERERVQNIRNLEKAVLQKLVKK